MFQSREQCLKNEEFLILNLSVSSPIEFIEQLLWLVHAKGQRFDDVGEEIRSAAICLHIPLFHFPIDLHIYKLDPSLELFFSF